MDGFDQNVNVKVKIKSCVHNRVNIYHISSTISNMKYKGSLLPRSAHKTKQREKIIGTASGVAFSEEQRFSRILFPQAQGVCYRDEVLIILRHDSCVKEYFSFFAVIKVLNIYR